MAISNNESPLGLGPGAGLDDIKHAYRKRAKRMHPDFDRSKNASERFSRLTDAYREALKRREFVNSAILDMRERRNSEDHLKQEAEFSQCVKELRETRRPSQFARKVASCSARCIGALALAVLICVIFAEGLFPGSVTGVALQLSDALANHGIDVSGLVAGVDVLLTPLRNIFS
jgi:hypothetical protein